MQIMRISGKLIVAGFVATITASTLSLTTAYAGQSDHTRSDHKTSRRHVRDAKPSHSAARPRPATACAEYGPGFMPVQGSSTCIKIGGSIGVGVGGRLR